MTPDRSDAITSLTEVLVPLDGQDPSARAVPYALRVAERLGIGLRLVSASEDAEPAKIFLQRVSAELPSASPITTDVVAGGDVVASIVEAAGATALVCMATSATVRPHHGHVGSVAEGVVRELGRPAMLLGPNADVDAGTATRRVIVSIDGSELSERSLDIGGDLARALGVNLWVVSVVSQQAEAEASLRVGHVFAAESGYVKRHADELAERYAIRTGYEVLHMNDPADALVDFAGSDGMVVMSTHGRSGLNRVFGGSVTTEVVARSKRPVVVVRPSDEGVD